jgi:hypothetical protein
VGERAAADREARDVERRDGGERDARAACPDVGHGVPEIDAASALRRPSEVRVHEREREPSARPDVVARPRQLDGGDEVRLERGLAARDGARGGLARPGGPRERADGERDRGERRRQCAGEDGRPERDAGAEEERRRAAEDDGERRGEAEAHRREEDDPDLPPSRPVEDACDLSVRDRHPPRSTRSSASGSGGGERITALRHQRADSGMTWPNL